MAAADFLDNLSQGIGAQFTKYAEELLSVPHCQMAPAFSVAMTALFAAIVQEGASKKGAERLIRFLDTPALDTNIVFDLDVYLRDKEKAQRLTALGRSMMPYVFGSRLDNVIVTIASSCGLNKETASRLLELATPTVLSFLKTLVYRDHLDAGALSNLLAEQNWNIWKYMDPYLASTVGMVPPTVFVADLGAENARLTIRREKFGRHNALTGATENWGFVSWWLWPALAAIGFFAATVL